ncbi:MAG: hypothetical protein JWR69_3422 [Pedosphaera sp.]|nr:hypothetical protein [Pedosphaera sp.]
MSAVPLQARHLADPPPQLEAENPSGSGSSNSFSVPDKRISKSFSVQPGGKLIIDADQGSIEVSTADQNTVELLVEREIKGGSDSQIAKLLKEHQVTFVQEGNVVRVKAEKTKSLRGSSWRRPSLEVHFRLTVPRQFDLTLATAGGDVQAADLQGKVDARTSGGNLTLNKIAGPVNARTSGGDIKAVGCTAKLQLHTSGGNIEIKDFAGPSVEASTSGGNVSGDFAGQPESDCSFRTSGGDITVKIPGATAFNLDAGTSGGTVGSAIPVAVEGKHRENALHGTINGGGPALVLKTSGGDVRIRKR